MSARKSGKGNRPDRIESVVTAIRILEVMAKADGPLALGEIARLARIGTSSAHRYIQSMLATGMVTQDGPNKPYDLGQNALEIGLAAARRFDHLEAASDKIKELCRALGVSGGIAVWTERGPTLVRWFRGEVFSVASLKLGDVLPLDNTACGLVFQAFLTESQIEAAREAQPPAFRGTAPGAGVIEEIRSGGGSSLTGHLVKGVTGQAVPVFDAQGEITCVMTIVAGIGFVESADHMKRLVDAADSLNCASGRHG